MEKISLYDLLSILLPGSILTMILQFATIDIGINIEFFELNSYFTMTLFLSFSIFLGSAINILTRTLIEKKIRWRFLYLPISEIYKKSNQLNPTKPFFEKKMDEIKKTIFKSKDKKKASEENEVLHEAVEILWSDIYYYLESNEKITVPKNFQSFYFFFRNFFTLGLLILLILITLSIFKGIDIRYNLMMIIDAISMIISIIAANWNREKMVERMFWTYYSLKNS